MPAKKTWTKENLKNAVMEGRSVRDVVRRLGLSIAGGSCAAIKKAILEEGFNTDHFLKYKTKQERDLSKRSPISAFTKESNASKNTIKRLLKRHNLIPFQCKCGLIDEWQGKKLVLQLEHKNGNTKDNRLENLEWLCANCHSQTSTYAGRNRNSDAWKDGAKLFGVDYSLARSTPGLLKRKVDHQKVIGFYNESKNLRATARKFGITHQSVMHIVETKTAQE